MKTVHKSILIWYSADEMFALVTDVASYSQFLPWCASASVVAQTEHGMTAKIDMALAGLKQSFTTQNTHVPGQKITMHLLDGPFSKLEGTWDFVELGSGDETLKGACKVEFTLHYAFGSSTLAALVGPVFDKIAGSLVDAFVKRAQQVYGPA